MGDGVLRVEPRRHSDVSGRRYARRRPERTVLHPIVRQHIDDFFRAARERADKGLPKYVERELRAYLDCGLPERDEWDDPYPEPSETTALDVAPAAAPPGSRPARRRAPRRGHRCAWIRSLCPVFRHG